jgi:hypothetical protein
VFDQTTRDLNYLQISTSELADADLPYLLKSPGATTTEGLAYFGCLFHALFRPSEALEAAVKHEIEEMFRRELKPGEGYVAAHVRVRSLHCAAPPCRGLQVPGGALRALCCWCRA